MPKWSSYVVLLVCTALLSASLDGQWSQTGGALLPEGQYPQSQYPQQAGSYPQSQYPGNPAQPQPQIQQGPANPADLQHGVARISIVQGDVNVRRGDNGEFVGAVINAPLTLHDHLETSGGSRAEVELDAVTLLRLAPNTDVGLADLQYHRAQIQLALGSIIFRVLQNSPTQVEIDTPSVGFRALAPGDYRISVFEDGTSQISVRGGQAELLAPRGSERLDAGRTVMVRGDASNPELQDVAGVASDQFDDWSAGRDREVAASQSTQYVNTDVQGASDLDRYGAWVPSGYGQVWQPQGVAPDWSPYSNGQWSYVDYYGWSWIDYSPWGWAPYHYGRWFYNTGYGWCWWPGQRLYPAYYSPALVGFFGVGVGVGIGLGWVALAPFEIFHPWWGVGGFGFRGGFGLASFRNAAFRGGVLTAPLNGFAGPHQRFAVATHSQIINASAIGGRLPVTNIRAGMNYSGRAVAPNSRFNSVQSRSFYNGAGRSSSNFAARSSSSTNAGWQRFGSPGAAAPRQSFHTSEPSGWHTFGQPANASRSYQSSAPRSYSPSYQQPRSSYSGAQRSYSQPTYQQPRSSYSAPRQSYSAPAARQSQPHASSSKPQASHSSGGGGGHPSGGGSHGGGGGHHGR